MLVEIIKGLIRTHRATELGLRYNRQNNIL